MDKKLTLLSELSLISIIILVSLSVIGFSAPNITNFTYPKKYAKIYSTVNISANVTDNETLDSVITEFVSPKVEYYNMTNINGTDIYVLNYTPTNMTVYIFRIFANDTAGENSTSPWGYFTCVDIKNVTINVSVAASCCGDYSLFWVPEKVVQNQTIAIFAFFRNCGNLVENETTSFTIKNSTGQNVGYFMGSDKPGFVISDQETLESLEDQFHWGVWYSEGLPLGNYTAIVHTDYSSIYDITNETFVWSELEAGANCTDVVDSHANCTNTTWSGCTYKYGESIELLTPNITNLSSVNLSSSIAGNMTPNSTVYEGSNKVGESNYTVFIFNMSDCSDYCFICMSLDRNITDSECAYEGYVIPSNGYDVESVASDGHKATVREVTRNCDYKVKYYDCLVIEALDFANCTIRYGCGGYAEMNKTFEIVESLGNKTQPEPQPTPEPSPSPTPQPETGATGAGATEKPKEGEIKIVITPVKSEVDGYQEEWAPVVFNVTNVGTEEAENITLVPIVPEGWSEQNATVSYINTSQTLNRTIFVNPSTEVSPGIYAIPVKAMFGNQTLDLNYFWIKVLPGRNLTRLEIIEFPQILGLESMKNYTIAILLKNSGKLPLHNITIRMENVEQCIDMQSYTTGNLTANQTSSFNIYIRSKVGPKTCPGMLIVGSAEKAYAFAPITIKVSAPFAFIPKLAITPILILFITITLMLILKYRKKQKRLNLRTIDEIFLALLFIDIILFIYVFLWVLGYVSLI